jgi:sec-independent protein translocase protein TatA
MKLRPEYGGKPDGQRTIGSMGVELLQPTHLLFLALLALIVFGPKRLPEIGRSLGTGLREFKGSVTGLGLNDPVGEPVEARAEATTQATAETVPASATPPPPPAG